MRCSPAHACLIRKLRMVLADSPDEWEAFCVFNRQIKDRFDGQDFSQLSLEELNTLSAYATLAREGSLHHCSSTVSTL